MLPSRWRLLEGVVLAAVMYGAWVLLQKHLFWYVDDAAISFAFARNWADGLGLVAYPGGERVEGYSNPLWVLLLAGFHWFGFNLFDVAKWLGAVLATGTVPLLWLAGRRSGGPWLGLAAAATIATSAQLAIWATSGLEPALFCFALSGAIWRTLADHQDRTFPWAALWFVGVATTRPEGIAYAAIGGFWFLVLELHAGRGVRRVGWWLLAFWAPFLAYHGVRYWYFAWEFPATYYAKAGYTDRADTRGVRQAKEWAWGLGHANLLPVYLVGLVGTHPWRRVDRWPLRALAATLALFGLWFAVWSGGDWMKGFRWMSLFAVPLAALYALGAWDLGLLFRRLGGWAPPVVTGALVVALAGPNLDFIDAQKPVAPPRSIKTRTDHYFDLKNRLHLDRVVIVDHDMGAMLWWGGPLGDIYDTQGLVNVPFAVNRNKPGFKRFVTEYLFEDEPFDFAHTHGRTKQVLRRRTDFQRQFVEVDNYPPRRRSHNANWVRRDLFLPQDPGLEPLAGFGGVALYRLEMKGEITAASRSPLIDVAVGVDAGMPGYRMVIFLAGPGGLVMRDAPPAYGWVPVNQWRVNEVFTAQFEVPLPKDSLPGDWDLGVVIFDDKGRVIPPRVVPEGALVGAPGEARVAAGELRWPGAVKVLSRNELNKRVDDHLSAVRDLARDGDCEGAEGRWDLARWAQSGLDTFLGNQRPGAATALASCWASRGAELEGEAQVDAFERARRWDHANKRLERLGAPVADRLYAQGLEARRQGRHKDAQERFHDVLRIDPSRSWARRHLEEARWARFEGARPR